MFRDCPGFSQDRVNFHQEPGGLTQPGQTEQGIPYRVPSCRVPVGGSWAARRVVGRSCGSGARGGGGQ